MKSYFIKRYYVEMEILRFEYNGHELLHFKDRARWFAARLGKLQYLHNYMSNYRVQYTILKEIDCSIL